MKRLLPAAMIVLGWASAAYAAAPVALTTLQAIHALTNADAEKLPPVAFEATVVYFNRETRVLNVQEGDEAIYVKATTETRMVPGDRVLVEGTAHPSFLPYVVSDQVSFLRHGELPKPVPATFDDLFSKKINCRLVTVHGVIRTADLVSSQVAPSGHLQLLMEGGYVDIEIVSNDQAALKNLLDAEVEITGAAGRKFDGKMEQTGAKIKVESPADIHVTGRAGADPWALPATPLGEIITGRHVREMSQRLRVHGVITYYQPGSAVVLQDGDQSLWVSTQTSDSLRIGDVADATGFPETRDGLLVLNHAEIQDRRFQAPVTPQPANWRQLAFWGRSVLGGHSYDLVSIEGFVVTEVRESSQDEYVLVSDGQMFTAIYRHPPPPNPVPRMLLVPIGTKIRVTGICMTLDGEPYNDEAPFDILMRSFDDIQVIAKPSWLNIRHLTLTVGLLLAVLFAVGIKGWTLDRKVRRQTAALAYLERRRSRILENINGVHPLAEIIEQITEVVSYKLQGAACWCQIADGARLGNCPPKLDSLRIAQMDIPAHSGGSNGTIFAAFDRLTKPGLDEREALQMGAGLASLAIETRRLYADLLHRSEFDLLTDLHNRFSIDRQLDSLIETVRKTAGIFGLIYIDLDDFKRVNDLYGHLVGDLYLKEAAQRMKRQLRPDDILARLGGDEFVVLVPVVRNRAEVEEIALRLERCLEDPFEAEGYVVHGSASAGIALYPEDAATKDGLLSAADASMYVVKHTKS
jgi:diguanylate cyclase (GGDEF)-like protein